MHWTDTAILLSARKHGENSAVARLFAREHGVFAGVVRGVASKTNRGIFQPGNIVSATWNARLSEHLGSFKAELLEANAAHIMQDAGRLAALISACAVIESALPERHPYAKLYKIFQAFLATLRDEDDWQESYVRLEMEVLAESGFGLDLSRCAATGATENLIYVSPKSGRAVCAEAGEPYREKLLKLPKILWRDSERRIPKDPAQRSSDSQDVVAGMALTGYFLEHWLLEPHRRKLPAARGRLLERLRYDILGENRELAP